MANSAGLWTAVNSIMLFRQTDPNHAHRIVRSRRYLSLRIFRLGIPKQRRIVMEPGVMIDLGDLPVTDGQRVMLASHGGWILGEQHTIGAIRGYRAVLFGNDHFVGGHHVLARYIRNHNFLASLR